MRTRRNITRREPTIALINVVFLMLIFFLIAGTVAAPVSTDLTLIKTSALSAAAPPDGLVIHADGRMESGGRAVSDVAAYVAALPDEDKANLRIVPDRDLPARTLLQIGAAMRSAGAESVIIATEKALQ